MSEQQLQLPLVELIRERFAQITELCGDLIEYSAEIGNAVKQGREETGDAFGEWCKELPFSERTAELFENIADRKDELEQAELFNLAIQAMGRAPKELQLKGPELVWAKYSAPLGNFFAWVQKRRDESPVQEWPPFYQRALRDRLKPAIELARELDEVLENVQSEPAKTQDTEL